MFQVSSFKFQEKKGFTLLELLITVAILAILATVVVLVLNPAEILKKTRDSQRLSDMNTLRAAAAIYIAQTTEPQLDGTAKSNSGCVDGAGWDTIWPSIQDTITDTSGPASFPPTGRNVFGQEGAPKPNLFKTDGTGWVPINFSGLKGGPPFSQLPVDPTNTAADLANITNADLFYRYSCRSSQASNNSTTFEFNARMESDDFKPGGGSDKAARDGGNNSNLYEVGTDLTILPSTNDF